MTLKSRVLTGSPEQIKYYNSDSVSILANLTKCKKEFTFDADNGYLIHEIK